MNEVIQLIESWKGRNPFSNQVNSLEKNKKGKKHGKKCRNPFSNQVNSLTTKILLQ